MRQRIKGTCSLGKKAILFLLIAEVLLFRHIWYDQFVIIVKNTRFFSQNRFCSTVQLNNSEIRQRFLQYTTLAQSSTDSVGFNRASSNRSVVLEGRDPNATSSSIRPRSTVNISAYSSFILVQNHSKRSLGECIIVQKPFFFPNKSVRPSTLARNPRCANFAKSRTILSNVCAKYVSSQRWETPEISYAKITSANKRTPFPCASASSAVIIPMSWRDYNVCHLLMKFLLGFTVTQRAERAPDWLSIPPVSTVIIVAPQRPIRALMKLTKSTFHSDFTRQLFVNAGIEVVVTPSLTHLREMPLCFQAAAIVGSHANRFSFPDASLGPHGGYFGRPALPAPLSSDALALRSVIFRDRAPPLMRNKILYVARNRGRPRSFTRTGERELRYMLQEVAAEEQAELVIFETVKRVPTFRQQLEMYADASVIIGMHGAGLALTVFAPREAALIEIEPEDHRLKLFGNVRSSGIHYAMVRLQKGTREKRGFGSNLVRADRIKLKEVLKENVRRGKTFICSRP